MIGTVKELIPKMLELDDEKQYELREYKRKRSLDANAYYWVLVTKIADVIRASKEEVHRKMLRDYGQITSICVPSDYNLNGFIKYFEYDGAFKRNDKLFYTYKVYKPSSEMDTREMSILIDGVVSEAKELGIDTLTPNQLADLKSQWEQCFK